MEVKLEVKKEVMRFTQDDCLVCWKHLSTDEGGTPSEFTSMSEAN